jgi:hypothetical protein
MRPGEELFANRLAAYQEASSALERVEALCDFGSVTVDARRADVVEETVIATRPKRRLSIVPVASVRRSPVSGERYRATTVI